MSPLSNCQLMGVWRKSKVILPRLLVHLVIGDLKGNRLGIILTIPFCIMIESPIIQSNLVVVRHIFIY
jgi:hypothetical protein